jgi:hypothetical protein
MIARRANPTFHQAPRANGEHKRSMQQNKKRSLQDRVRFPRTAECGSRGSEKLHSGVRMLEVLVVAAPGIIIAPAKGQSSRRCKGVGIQPNSMVHARRVHAVRHLQNAGGVGGRPSFNRNRRPHI